MSDDSNDSVFVFHNALHYTALYWENWMLSFGMNDISDKILIICFYCAMQFMKIYIYNSIIYFSRDDFSFYAPFIIVWEV